MVKAFQNVRLFYWVQSKVILHFILIINRLISLVDIPCQHWHGICICICKNKAMETDHIVIEGTDVKEIFKQSVPELQIEQSSECNINKIIDRFAGYTIDLIKKGNLPAIKNCFSAADQMLADGSNEVKQAIENVYVFSISIFFDMAHAVSKQVKELLPEHLMEEYHKQVGCCQK